MHAYHRDCERLIQTWRLGVYTNTGQTAADESFDRLLVDGQHFAFDSQEWRPPWPTPRRGFQLPWCLRLYATQCRLCSLHRMHGCPAARVVQARPPVGPTPVPVPQWCRRDVPLCLPDTADWPIVELPDRELRPPGRSSYRKARRPSAKPSTRTRERVSPPTAHLNSTTEHTGD